MKNKKIFIIPTAAIALSFLVGCRTLNNSITNSANVNNNNTSDIIIDDNVEPTPNVDPVTRVTVTFDANGGTFKDGKSTKIFHVRKGLTWKLQQKYDPYKEITKTDRTFDHWSYLDGGTAKKITDAYTFNNDVTLTANYQTCTVTFAYDGGSGPANKVVEIGSKWGDIKNQISVTPPSGSTFTNFTYGSSPAVEVTDAYKFTTDVTFTANYKKNAVTLIVDPNGGTWTTGGGSNIKYESVDYGTTWDKKVNSYLVTAPTGYTYKAMQYNKNGAWTDISTPSSHQITGVGNDNYIKARYEANDITITIKCGDGTWTTGGGQADKTPTVKYDSTWADIKSTYQVTAPTGKVFTHFTNAAGEVIGDSYVFKDTTNKETLTANYVDSGQVATVTFRTNKGSLPYKEATFAKGQTWSTVNVNNKYNAIAPDGYTFKEYTADGKSVTGTYVINDNATFTATFTEASASNFVTDSWAVFSKEADKGLDALKTTYASEYAREDTSTGKVKDSFIGSKRNVTLNDGSVYPVTVIGQGVDDVNESNKATLTFQFDNVVDQISFNKYETGFTSKYENSVIQKKLNNDIYNKLNDDVKSAIVPVYKSTYEGGGKNKEVKSYQEKLFALSATEMGYGKVGTYPDTSAIKPDGLGTAHDTKYAYYSEVTSYENETAHTKTELNSTSNCAYWLRAPDTDIEGFAWNIDLDGKLGHIHDEEVGKESLEVYTTIGVAPAFSVGVNKKSFIFQAGTTDKGYTIEGIDYDLYELKGVVGSKVLIDNIKPKNGKTISNWEVSWNGVTQSTGFSTGGDATTGIYHIEFTSMPAYDVTIKITTGANI